MCLLLFSYRSHPRYKLVLAGNRDEFYQRPTAPAAFWEDAPHVLAGRDLEKGGTWMGITRSGRFAALTNYRSPEHNRPDAASRGFLVSDYLMGKEHPMAYLTLVQKNKEQYNGFNLLVGNTNGLYYYSPLLDEVTEVTPGIHGVSNAVLDTPWPKVRKGVQGISTIMQQESIRERELFTILADAEQAGEEELPDTGVGIEWERLLSSLFIASEEYGTRAMTVFTIDNDNNIMFTEKSLHPITREWEESQFFFTAE
ncbi:NRDE family protein [Aneurinibacillus sp. REN35]|uniref:NRDE family protein n=1 Tax=Aneurinibacillus sp. REN35 TaxID=3237286 RepID=UPI0035284057